MSHSRHAVKPFFGFTNALSDLMSVCAADAYFMYESTSSRKCEKPRVRSAINSRWHMPLASATPAPGRAQCTCVCASTPGVRMVMLAAERVTIRALMVNAEGIAGYNLRLAAPLCRRFGDGSKKSGRQVLFVPVEG